MRTVGRLLAKGLLTILPIVLTVYFIYWLGVTTESLLSGLLKVWLPAEIYVPGMGLVAGFVVLLVGERLRGAPCDHVQRVTDFTCPRGQDRLLGGPRFDRPYEGGREGWRTAARRDGAVRSR